MELRELFVKQMNSLYLKIVHDKIILLQFVLQLKNTFKGDKQTNTLFINFLSIS